MTKKLSIAGLVVAAAASSAFAFGAAPAKAACLPSDPSATCSTFDPSTASKVGNYAGFTGTLTPPPSSPLAQARVQFSFVGTWNTSFNISGISLQGDGITGSLSFSDVTVSSSPSAFSSNTTAWVNLSTTIASVDFAANPLSKLSFTIPAGAATSGATITARIQYQDAAETQLLTSGGNILSAATGGGGAGVPGPLPLLGAGAAFGFSRSMRRRIAQSV
jgi:hypothetical protein